MTLEKIQSDTTDIQPIHDEIYEYIENNRSCLLGDIIKRFSLSYKSGFDYVEFLRYNGLITNKINPPFYTIVNFDN